MSCAASTLENSLLQELGAFRIGCAIHLSSVPDQCWSRGLILNQKIKFECILPNIEMDDFPSAARVIVHTGSHVLFYKQKNYTEKYLFVCHCAQDRSDRTRKQQV
jgi:hypothetical protein